MTKWTVVNRKEVMDIRDKVELALRNKVEQGKIHETTVTIVKGGAKLTYGLARGALSVAAILGHGLAGFAIRRPLTAGAGAKMIKEGFKQPGKILTRACKSSTTDYASVGTNDAHSPLAAACVPFGICLAHPPGDLAFLPIPSACGFSL
jgi:hypothetical protein